MKKAYYALAVVCLCGIVLLLVYWAKQPTKTTVVLKSLPDTAVTSNSVELSTEFFTATLPAGFIVKSQTKNATSQDLLQIMATQPVSSGGQIAITIGVLSNQGLDGVASYNMRIKSPETYVKTVFGGGQGAVISFYGQQNAIYELSGFWPKDDRYASIAVSGLQSQKEATIKYYTQVISSWQWR